MRYHLLLIIFSICLYSTSISNYKLKKGCIINNGKEYSILRSFKKDGKDAVLMVDTEELSSSVKSIKEFNLTECNKDSKYSKLLRTSSSPPYPLENDGIGNGGDNAVFITTDLCPSSKDGYEKRLYKALIKSFPNPVPITVFVTQRWIRKHQKAFEDLKRFENSKKLSIVWGNHTAYHHYHPKVPLNKNFVLSPEENLSKDIFELEIELLKRETIPSIFFRFPGLVSNKESIKIVKDLGLIVIGSDCWLAKGQTVKKGSIILLHGNKNEPKGIDIFLKMIVDEVLTPKSIKKLQFDLNDNEKKETNLDSE